MSPARIESSSLTPANLADIARGNALAPGEALVWQGAPSWRRIARDTLHVRALLTYFAVLFAIDGVQAWHKGLTISRALYDSVPLAVIASIVVALCLAAAWGISRTTRYIVTDARVILRYGVALTATLSIPMNRVAATSVAARRDGTADIALRLNPGERMPFLKLWPHARAWHVAEPQPMLRAVPQGGAVATLLVRALQQAERARAPREAMREVRRISA